MRGGEGVGEVREGVRVWERRVRGVRVWER